MSDYNKRQNYNQGDRGKKGPYDPIAAKADRYIAPVKAILNLKTATPLEIKDGVNTIKEMLFNNKTVTAHQVRNIFDLINEIDPEKQGNNESLKDLNMLRPKLAYIGARQTNDDGKVIVFVLDQLIINVTNETDSGIIKNKIKGLRYIMESIVAYQKFYSKN
jgi:CRISPR type III-A-associated protein Csm2